MIEAGTLVRAQLRGNRSRALYFIDSVQGELVTYRRVSRLERSGIPVLPDRFHVRRAASFERVRLVRSRASLERLLGGPE